MSVRSAEVVADPVSHISISGVHGRDELNARLARAPKYHNGAASPVRPLLLGAAIGVLLMALFRK